jgi:hypothetical protein
MPYDGKQVVLTNGPVAVHVVKSKSQVTLRITAVWEQCAAIDNDLVELPVEVLVVHRHTPVEEGAKLCSKTTVVPLS